MPTDQGVFARHDAACDRVRIGDFGILFAGAKGEFSACEGDVRAVFGIYRRVGSDPCVLRASDRDRVVGRQRLTNGVFGTIWDDAKENSQASQKNLKNLLQFAKKCDIIPLVQNIGV